MVAAKKGDLETVNLLLNHKARVNYKDKNGKTALYYALEPSAENPGIISILLQHRAEVRVRTSENMTPFLKAVELGYQNTIDRLLQARANVNDFFEETSNQWLMLQKFW